MKTFNFVLSALPRSSALTPGLASAVALSALLLSGCAGSVSHAAGPTTSLPFADQATQFVKTCATTPLARAGETLQYCFTDPAGIGKGTDSSVTVLFYFHQLGGNPSDIFEGNDRPVLDAIYNALGAHAPIVASLSLGPTGVFGDDTGELLNSGLPAIEAAIAPGKTVRRILAGGSMGGYNVLRLAAAGGPAKFHAVAALCPAIATFNGYDDAAVAAYRARNAATLDNALFAEALTVFKQHLTSAADWDANNPFTFENNGAYDGLPIFMSVGTEDTLGFLEGSREFLRRAGGRPAMNVDYHEVGGPHCSFDGTSLLRFIVLHAAN
jgi:hypothetical protein